LELIWTGRQVDAGADGMRAARNEAGENRRILPSRAHGRQAESGWPGFARLRRRD
jgi:hypothetical protein